MQQLTLLEGVNQVLLKTANTLAADLFSPLTESQIGAKANLEAKTQEHFAKQWAFNKITRKELVPDINGEIHIPSNWQLTSPYYPGDQGDLRFIEGRLHSDRDKTNVFTQPVHFNARIVTSFENMPYGHQLLVIVSAAISLNLSTKANVAINTMLVGELPAARQAAMTADQLFAGDTFFSHSPLRYPQI